MATIFTPQGRKHLACHERRWIILICFRTLGLIASAAGIIAFSILAIRSTKLHSNVLGSIQSYGGAVAGLFGYSFLVHFGTLYALVFHAKRIAPGINVCLDLIAWILVGWFAKVAIVCSVAFDLLDQSDLKDLCDNKVDSVTGTSSYTSSSYYYTPTPVVPQTEPGYTFLGFQNTTDCTNGLRALAVMLKVAAVFAGIAIWCHLIMFWFACSRLRQLRKEKRAKIQAERILRNSGVVLVEQPAPEYQATVPTQTEQTKQPHVQTAQV